MKNVLPLNRVVCEKILGAALYAKLEQDYELAHTMALSGDLPPIERRCAVYALCSHVDEGSEIRDLLLLVRDRTHPPVVREPGLSYLSRRYRHEFAGFLLDMLNAPEEHYDIQALSYKWLSVIFGRKRWESIGYDYKPSLAEMREAATELEPTIRRICSTLGDD